LDIEFKKSSPENSGMMHKYHTRLGQIHCQDVINANQLKWRGDLSNKLPLIGKTRRRKTQYREKWSIKA